MRAAAPAHTGAIHAACVPAARTPVYTSGIEEPAPPPAQDGVAADPRGAPPLVWVNSTYFAEGFPYALVNNVAEVLFNALGASLAAIGLTAVFHLPWNIKFLWAPVLDAHETKRSFLIGCEWVIAALVLVLAIAGTGISLPVASAIFVVLAFASATHDIAIDAYYLEALDAPGQSRYVGLRAAAFRAAALVASGPLLVVAGYWGWHATWALALAIMIVLLVLHRGWLPRVEPRRRPLRQWLRGLLRPRVLALLAVAAGLLALDASVGLVRRPWHALRDAVAQVPGLRELDVAGWIGVALLLLVIPTVISLPWLRRRLQRSDSNYARAFVAYLDHPDISRALALIVLFRTGESFLMKMRMPFLRNECGLSLETYGMVNGTLGFLATLLATLAGGWLIGRYGLRRCLWPMVLAQNLPNLLYAVLAAADPSSLGTPAVAAVVIVEDIGAGFGTAVFMVYIMRCCDPRHKATHMALMTAIMSIGFTLAGAASGFVVPWVGGWTHFFALTFVATIPSMLVLPFAPFLDRSRADEVAAAAAAAPPVDRSRP